MSRINLMIDEENELTFNVKIEGSRPGEAKCRLMLESNNISLGFNGYSDGSSVIVTLPPLDHIIKEGVYDMSLEVVVDDRYFEPLTIQGEFEKRLKVTAESVKVKTKPTVSTQASLVEVRRKSDTFSKSSPVSVVSESKPNKKSKKKITDDEILNFINKISK